MPKVRKYVDAVILLCQSLLAGLALLTLSPIYQTVPHRDSGIFLFIGSQILKGKVLYQQTWDNKQPLLYAINAVGLWLGNGSVWGVWALESALLIIALALMYLLLRRALPPLASGMISLASFLTIYQIMSGNFSEEYAMFFQICLLTVLFLTYLPASRRGTRIGSALGIGVLTGLVFCIKQTYIDLAAAIVLYFLFLAWLEQDVKRLLDLLWVAAGFILVNGAVFAYFAVHGAVHDYLVSAFLINKYYSTLGPMERIQSLLKTFEFTGTYPLMFLSMAIWWSGFILLLIHCASRVKDFAKKPIFRWLALGLGLVCIGLFTAAQLFGKPGIGYFQKTVLLLGLFFIALFIWSLLKKSPSPVATDKKDSLRLRLLRFNWHRPASASFFFLGIIDLPVVMLAISLSGMNFNHYYITLFTPLFLLLSAASFYLVEQSENNGHILIAQVGLIGVFIASMFSPTLSIYNRLQLSGSTDARAKTAAYLKSVTTPQQKILQWGWEAGIYFMADREPPTRYSFQFPAYMASPYQDNVQSTLLADIQADPPAYIADLRDPSMPFIQSESTAACLQSNPLDGNKLHALLNYVCKNYEYIKSFGSTNIYKYTGN